MLFREERWIRGGLPLLPVRAETRDLLSFDQAHQGTVDGGLGDVADAEDADDAAR